MAGISSKALNFGSPVNRDKTFQGQRFDDELGLNWVQFKWRNHDPQIGRFIELDPLSEDYEYNSTYAFSENKVIVHVELEGLESWHINFNVIPADKREELKRDFGKGHNQGLDKGVPFVVAGLLLLTPGPDELLIAGLFAKLYRGYKAADKINDTRKTIDKAEDATDVKKVPNPNGRKGGPEHQNKMEEVVEDLKKDGYDQVKKEVKVETPGGTKDKRYVDVQGTNSTTGATKQVQVGKQNKNGSPVSREKKALDDVEKATGTRPDFVPYNKQ